MITLVRKSRVHTRRPTKSNSRSTIRRKDVIPSAQRRSIFFAHAKAHSIPVKLFSDKNNTDSIRTIYKNLELLRKLQTQSKSKNIRVFES